MITLTEDVDLDMDSTDFAADRKEVNKKSISAHTKGTQILKITYEEALT
jgi:hypothetical protein